MPLLSITDGGGLSFTPDGSRLAVGLPEHSHNLSGFFRSMMFVLDVESGSTVAQLAGNGPDSDFSDTFLLPVRASGDALYFRESVNGVVAVDRNR